MKNFLLVDDDLVLLNSYKSLIKSKYDNVHVVHALNGKVGLEEVRKQDYSIIISDIGMPVMDGIEFHKRLKIENLAMSKRVIFISGSFHPPLLSYIDKEKCPLLAKPFEPKEFFEVVDYLL